SRTSRRRRLVANLRRPHASTPASDDSRCRHAPGDRGVDDIRPGLRPDPRRSGHVDAAHLDLRLPDLLPVPAGRLRGGDAVHRRPGGHPRLGLRRRPDAEPRAMTRDRLNRFAWAVGALTALMFAVTPLVWMLLTSVKSNREITQETSLIPQALTSANYVSLFSGRQFGAYLTNSVIVTALSVAIALALGTMAAYVLARFRLPFGVHR